MSIGFLFRAPMGGCFYKMVFEIMIIFPVKFENVFYSPTTYGDASVPREHSAASLYTMQSASQTYIADLRELISQASQRA